MTWTLISDWFRGLQKQLHRPRNLHKLPEDEISAVYRLDEVTVQGALESALWHTLRPVHHVKLTTSCREGNYFLKTGSVHLYSTEEYFKKTFFHR